jgi:hypothetical protein
VDDITDSYPVAQIIIASDVNQLQKLVVTHRTGLVQVFQQPTRGAKILDRAFSSGPIYDTVREVNFVCKSDHKAVIVHQTGDQFHCQRKRTGTKRVYRKNHHPSMPFFCSMSQC